jgi:hypothetical protein
VAPGDLALVYWSGHGTRWLDNKNRSRVFLAATDTRRDAATDTAIPLESMQQFLESLPTTSRVLVVDACFTGQGKVDEDDAEAAARAVLDEPVPFSTRNQEEEAQLFATTHGRPALESKTLGHGVFTWHFTQALTERFDEADVDDDGVISVSEAFDHARDRTMEATKDRQLPMAVYKIVGREKILLSGDPSARRRARLAMITAYEGAQQGVRLIVDGRERGAFPRSVLVEPGPHVIEFQTLSGKVIDRGLVTLKAESVHSVSRLRDTLNGGAHQLSLGYAHVWLPGEAGAGGGVPSAPGARIAWEARFPGQNPLVRRFGFGVDFGLGSFGPRGGEGGPPRTTVLDLGAGPLLRLDVPFFLLQVQPRAAVLALLRGREGGSAWPHWVLGALGVDLSVGVRPTNRLSIRAHYALMGFNAALQGERKTELLHRLAGVVSVGI